MPADEALGATVAGARGAAAGAAAVAGAEGEEPLQSEHRRRRMPREESRQAKQSCRRSLKEPPKEQWPAPKVSVPADEALSVTAS